jgi:hypothetical protein
MEPSKCPKCSCFNTLDYLKELVEYHEPQWLIRRVWWCKKCKIAVSKCETITYEPAVTSEEVTDG